MDLKSFKQHRSLGGSVTSDEAVTDNERTNFNFIDDEHHIQDSRRKMLRRAANRRSAQLSRARKKAQLEELKGEKARMQRLVDILDSQPELIVCITKDGSITYISEKSTNFMKLSLSGAEESPSHLNQILSKDSVESVINTIAELDQHQFNDKLNLGRESASNTLFSSKKVYFHDEFGYPLVGYLRCSRVLGRKKIETEPSDGTENSDNESAPKKQRVSKDAVVKVEKKRKNDIEVKIESDGQWNLSNFKLLTDAVSSLIGDDNNNEIENSRDSRKIQKNNGSTCKVQSSNETNNSVASSEIENSSNSAIHQKEEPEFVCVIRTSDNCFVPHATSNNSGLFLFSSQLSTASIVAHDLELQGTGKRRPNSSEENSESNNSSGVAPNSDSSKQRNSTSSETCSDENTNENETIETNST